MLSPIDAFFSPFPDGPIELDQIFTFEFNGKKRTCSKRLLCKYSGHFKGLENSVTTEEINDQFISEESLIYFTKWIDGKIISFKKSHSGNSIEMVDESEEQISEEQIFNLLYLAEKWDVQKLKSQLLLELSNNKQDEVTNLILEIIKRENNQETQNQEIQNQEIQNQETQNQEILNQKLANLFDFVLFRLFNESNTLNVILPKISTSTLKDILQEAFQNKSISSISALFDFLKFMKDKKPQKEYLELEQLVNSLVFGTEPYLIVENLKYVPNQNQQNEDQNKGDKKNRHEYIKKSQVECEIDEKFIKLMNDLEKSKNEFNENYQSLIQQMNDSQKKNNQILEVTKEEVISLGNQNLPSAENMKKVVSQSYEIASKHSKIVEKDKENGIGQLISDYQGKLRYLQNEKKKVLKNSSFLNKTFLQHKTLCKSYDSALFKLLKFQTLPSNMHNSIFSLQEYPNDSISEMIYYFDNSYMIHPQFYTLGFYDNPSNISWEIMFSFEEGEVPPDDETKWILVDQHDFDQHLPAPDESYDVKWDEIFTLCFKFPPALIPNFIKIRVPSLCKLETYENNQRNKKEKNNHSNVLSHCFCHFQIYGTFEEKII
ncbi:hypothetical protein TRFO_20289 [Tritrichomonas foetus]|uniref:Uncharacterized protein n=1 Tax=Tritrichomonas foetus TaxID=1144522 RepID=A0A1J4KL40_9EUKA|nr:hypothetical protein TRFO_20289 [Tritrichomonas foetus]|eukprot:OHT10414.1 hypothetical protein TRFO_20289 [Tritrichomonas foetus]